MKFFKFKIICLLILILNFQLLFSTEIKNINFSEDIKIMEIENEIKLLENKIKKLKKEKEIKNKNFENIKVGLALSGGGAKGYAHLGVLKILEKENIKIDYITGTSIGALVGTLYSIGYSIDEIEEILDKLNIETFLESGSNLSDLSIEKKENLKKYSFHIKYDENFNFSLPKGFKDNQTIYLEIKKILGAYKDTTDTLSLPIPVKVIATNLNTGEAEALSKGDISKILSASMAIPALLEPIEIDGVPYVDGLVSRNLPVQDAYDMGADIVIASDIGTEVNNKNNYNILSILNQIIAIQSSYINKDSRNKASILIIPELQKISALDTDKKDDLIKLGEIASLKNLEYLEKLPKKDINQDKTKIIENKYFIKNIIYPEDFNSNIKEVFNNIFKSILNKNISDKDIQRKIIKIYNLKYANKLFYTVKGNSLIIEGDIEQHNNVGVGVNYKPGYGTSVNLGTDLYFNGKFGNILNFNLKFGDYLGLDLGTFSYYGRSNKIGVFSKLGYNEVPFYLYENNKKRAKFLNKELFLNLGLYSQPNSKTMLSYGISSKISNFKLHTGDSNLMENEYNGNINKTYLRFKYDTLDSISIPMSGIKADFIYNLSNSFGNMKTNSYGPSYTVKGYYPLNKKISLTYGLNSSIIRGDNIKLDQFIKIGGLFNNIENNEFEFHGLNFQEKSVKEFIALNLGFRYKLYYSLYLTSRFDIGTFKRRSEESSMWKKTSKGIGVSLSYDSPIGPVEFTISENLNRKKFLSSISIGYKLD